MLVLKQDYNKIRGQIIFSLGKVPIEILPGKLHITWVLVLLLFTIEFQMEPLTHNAISYDTRPTAKYVLANLV